MMTTKWLSMCVFVVGVSGALVAIADDKKSTLDVHTVAKGRLQVVVPLEGVLVAGRMHEVCLHPQAWTELNVVEAVDHGREVRKGDLLAKLDRRKIEQEIQDERAARKQAELAIEQLRAELRVLEPSVPVDLAAAERAKRNAAADLENFLAIGRDLAARSADVQVRYSEMRVDFAKDELVQLEKMYEADDLTEETEELILKRTRRQLELSQFSLEIARTSRNQILNIRLPRQEDDLGESVKQTELALDKVRTTLPLKLTKMKLDLDKQEYELAKATRKLEKLEHDAELHTVLAPADGIVYYGSCVDGEWTSADAMRKKLTRGGTLSAHEVFMTIIEPELLAVRVSVSEKALNSLTTATQCQVHPVAHPRKRLAARIEKIVPIPGADGKFSAMVKLEDQDSAAQELHLVPGMKCKVKAIVYDEDSRLIIPTKALHTDEFDDQQHFVNLIDEDTEHSRRDVAVGQRTETTVEITGGLAEGDKILLDAASGDKKD
jgi:HlyD family secretion protein